MSFLLLDKMHIANLPVTFWISICICIWLRVRWMISSLKCVSQKRVLLQFSKKNTELLHYISGYVLKKTKKHTLANYSNDEWNHWCNLKLRAQAFLQSLFLCNPGSLYVKRCVTLHVPIGISSDKCLLKFALLPLSSFLQPCPVQLWLMAQPPAPACCSGFINQLAVSRAAFLTTHVKNVIAYPPDEFLVMLAAPEKHENVRWWEVVAMIE